MGFIDLVILKEVGGGTMELRCIKMRAQVSVGATVTGPPTVFEFNKAPRFCCCSSGDIVGRGESSD
jgi:hypothetical protein